jgi:hypothetical protein
MENKCEWRLKDEPNSRIICGERRRERLRKIERINRAGAPRTTIICEKHRLNAWRLWGGGRDTVETPLK